MQLPSVFPSSCLAGASAGLRAAEAPAAALPHSLLMLFPAPKPQGTTLHKPQARRRLHCKGSAPSSARVRAEEEIAESERLWQFAGGKGPLPLTPFVEMLMEEFCFHEVWCSPSPSLLPINKELFWGKTWARFSCSSFEDLNLSNFKSLFKASDQLNYLTTVTHMAVTMQHDQRQLWSQATSGIL